MKADDYNGAPPPGFFEEADEAFASGTHARVVPLWRTGDQVEIGRRMLLILEDGGPEIVATAGAFWIYRSDAGTWSEVENAEMSRVIQGFAGARIPGGDGKTRPLKIKASDVKGAIDLAAAQRHVPDTWFRDVPVGLAFRDGFLRVTAEGCTLEPSHPEHRARFAYPFPHKAKHDDASWLKFLAGLFRDDDDAQEKIAFLQEFFGACLLGVVTRYQRALFCTGEGRNGKSTLFSILRSVFPPGTVSEIAPHSLRDDYARAALAGKLLNIVAEASTRELLDTESFKALVTGDPLQARHPYGRVFTLFPKAGHAYAPQNLPDVADASDGFWRRPVILEFRRQFVDVDDDKGLAERLSANAQPAIVAWLVEGAQRLVANSHYTIPKSHDIAISRWRLGSNNVAMFASEMLVHAKVAQDWTMGSTIYERYRTWVNANGYRPFAANQFGRRLAKLGFQSAHTMRGTSYAAKVLGPYDAREDDE